MRMFAPESAESLNALLSSEQYDSDENEGSREGNQEQQVINSTTLTGLAGAYVEERDYLDSTINLSIEEQCEPAEYDV
jgi:hypothetical protein